MKKIFTRAAMLLAVVAMASAFTACDDGDDGGKKKFESELIVTIRNKPPLTILFCERTLPPKKACST